MIKSAQEGTVLPDASHPCWRELANGQRSLKTQALGLQLILKRIERAARETPPGALRDVLINLGAEEIHAFFVKYEKLLGAELQALYEGSAPPRAILTADEAAERIRSGRWLVVAGDESILRRLPMGNWIGGSTPYLLDGQGVLETRDRVHVTELAGADCPVVLADPGQDDIRELPAQAPDNGYTVLIIPGGSGLHRQYAAEAQDYPGLFLKPIIGWIAGVHLDDLGRTEPVVVNGRTGQVSSSRAVAAHVPLRPDRMALVHIVNRYHPGDGDVFTFPRNGFSADECLVNGWPANFATYVQERGLDLSLPLVADYHGARINTSFQAVHPDQGRVDFFAPVFTGIDYRLAAPAAVPEGLPPGPRPSAAFACTCILNHQYGRLDAERSLPFTGPVGFGEIGYQLLNQTTVWLELLAI
jgi:hypothetical protein